MDVNQNYKKHQLLFIFGICFIICAIGLIALFVFKEYEKNNIKNNGIQVNATIYEISSKTKRTRSTVINNQKVYSIKYVINNETHYKSVSSSKKDLQKGDTIAIYCLPSEPTKVYVPIENNGNFMLVVMSILLIIPGIVIMRCSDIMKRVKQN